MKSSKQKKSLWHISILVLPLFCLSLSQCSNKTTPAKEKAPKVINPTPGGSGTNNSSPNKSENQAQLDSIKREGLKKKKQGKRR